jgi:hypothetical protein
MFKGVHLLFSTWSIRLRSDSVRWVLNIGLDVRLVSFGMQKQEIQREILRLDPETNSVKGHKLADMKEKGEKLIRKAEDCSFTH